MEVQGQLGRQRRHPQQQLSQRRHPRQMQTLDPDPSDPRLLYHWLIRAAVATVCVVVAGDCHGGVVAVRVGLLLPNYKPLL